MPPKLLLAYIADTGNPVPLAMRSYFERQGYLLEPYQNNKVFFEALLIFSPILHAHQYQSPEGVWARYLANEYPAVKMVVLGSIASKDPNYINLFDLPIDWQVFLAQVPPAKRFLQEKPVFTDGMDMEEKLKRFLVGHGNESVASIVGDTYIKLVPKLKSLRNDADGSVVQKLIGELSEERAANMRRILAARWYNYQNAFDYLPFHSIFEGLKVSIPLILDTTAWDIPKSHEEAKTALILYLENLKTAQADLHALDEYIEQV